MKTIRLKIGSVLLGLAMLLSFVTACSPKIETNLGKIVVDGDGYTVEAGTLFTVPSARFEDKDGNAAENVIVASQVRDPQDKPVTLRDGNAFLASVTGDYTIRYSAVYEETTIRRNVTVKSQDTQAPTVEIDNFEYYGATDGTLCALPEYTLKDFSGVKDNTTIRVYKGETGTEEVAVEKGVFKARKGSYRIAFAVEDILGNKAERSFPVSVSDKYLDEAAEPGVLWSFNDAEYENLVKPVYGYEAETSIAASHEGAVGVLKWSAQAGTSAIRLVDGLVQENEEPFSLSIRFAGDAQIASLRLCDSSTGEIYKTISSPFDGTWQEATATGLSGARLSRLLLYAEFSAPGALYIDRVSYKPYYIDETLAENVYADFDEKEYAGSSLLYAGVSKTDADRHSIGTLRVDVVDAAAEGAPEGIRGGAASLTATVAYNDEEYAGQDGQSAVIHFGAPVDIAALEYLLFRIYIPQSVYDNTQKIVFYALDENDDLTTGHWFHHVDAGEGGTMAVGWCNFALHKASLISSGGGSNPDGLIYGFEIRLPALGTIYLDEIRAVTGEDTTGAENVWADFDDAEAYGSSFAWQYGAERQLSASVGGGEVAGVNGKAAVLENDTEESAGKDILLLPATRALRAKDLGVRLKVMLSGPETCKLTVYTGDGGRVEREMVGTQNQWTGFLIEKTALGSSVCGFGISFTGKGRVYIDEITVYETNKDTELAQGVLMDFDEAVYDDWYRAAPAAGDKTYSAELARSGADGIKGGALAVTGAEMSANSYTDVFFMDTWSRKGFTSLSLRMFIPGQLQTDGSHLIITPLIGENKTSGTGWWIIPGTNFTYKPDAWNDIPLKLAGPELKDYPNLIGLRIQTHTAVKRACTVYLDEVRAVAERDEAIAAGGMMDFDEAAYADMLYADAGLSAEVLTGGIPADALNGAAAADGGVLKLSGNSDVNAHLEFAEEIDVKTCAYIEVKIFLPESWANANGAIVFSFTAALDGQIKEVSAHWAMKDSGHYRAGWNTFRFYVRTNGENAVADPILTQNPNVTKLWGVNVKYAAGTGGSVYIDSIVKN